MKNREFVFILGNNPKLSRAEILAVLPDAKEEIYTREYLIVQTKSFQGELLMRRLGGTVKIAEVISVGFEAQTIVDELEKEKRMGKVVFGISVYGKGGKEAGKRLGMEVKRLLKARGVNSRLVTSRQTVLSSVVITKNKCQEFIILSGSDMQDQTQILAKTCAVQEFEEYSSRDYGRPARDARSGMLPPKLAKIMLNLSQTKQDAVILDPFCGSGTILQEALLLGYNKVIGSDISKKAVEDTKKNLEWLHAPKFFKRKIWEGKAPNFQLLCCDVKKLTVCHPEFISRSLIDAIVTEPYLGPPLTGNESEKKLGEIIKELEELYMAAFEEFRKILKRGGKVVMVFPVFRGLSPISGISDTIQSLGFKKLNAVPLTYSRANQRLIREIYIFTMP